MSKINKQMSVKEIASVVSSALTKAKISAVLSGGAVVSIYSENEYESKDLDFVTASTMKSLEVVMKTLGFYKTKERYFAHKQTEFVVEFPNAPLAIGDETINNWEQLRTRRGVIQILSPTQCVMDRLAGYYHWNDLQNLDQAVMVAKKHPVGFKKIEGWSRAEGHSKKFENFKKKLDLK